MDKTSTLQAFGSCCCRSASWPMQHEHLEQEKEVVTTLITSMVEEGSEVDVTHLDVSPV